MVESLGLSRRLSKDYERLPKTLEPTIYGPMSLIMLGSWWDGVRPFALVSPNLLFAELALKQWVLAAA